MLVNEIIEREFCFFVLIGNKIDLYIYRFRIFEFLEFVNNDNKDCEFIVILNVDMLENVGGVEKVVIILM